MVYIREAHPTDGWALESNREQGVEYAQPATSVERVQVAEACAVGLRLTMPVLVDDMGNTTALQYNAWPERLYVLSADGKVAYQGGKGPYAFDPDELDRFLREYLRQS
jgi:hypothetical protein